MKLEYIASLLSLALSSAFAPTGAAQQLNRTVLPVPEPQPPTITELDARNAKAPPRFEVKAPTGAPNGRQKKWRKGAFPKRNHTCFQEMKVSM